MAFDRCVADVLSVRFTGLLQLRLGDCAASCRGKGAIRLTFEQIKGCRIIRRAKTENGGSWQRAG